MHKHQPNHRRPDTYQMELLRIGSPAAFGPRARLTPRPVARLRCVLCARIARALHKAAHWFEARSRLPA